MIDPVRIVDEVLHPLRHIICPSCSTRFGLDPSDAAFAEQTSALVWCPRGHRLRLVAAP